MEVSFCIFEWPERSSTYQQVGLGVQGAARVRWNAPNRCLCGTGATSVVFAPLSSQYGSSTYQQVGLGIQGAAPVRWKPPKAWNKSYKQKRIWGLCYETVLVLRGCNWSVILHL